MNAIRGCLAVLCFVFGCGCSTVGQGVALVIGNSNYKTVTRLNNPGNDADDVCKALQRLGFKATCPKDVQTAAEFERHVTAFVDELGPQATGLFFYSGHGVQASGENFLVPTDVSVNSAGENPISQLYPLSHLFAQLARKPEAIKMVVLDACRDDPFAPVPLVGAGNPPAGNVATRSALTKRSLEVVAKASYGTARINDAPAGTIVLYATASKDTAYDGKGRNGPLTKHFLLNVEKRGMSVEELIKKVTSGVQTDTMEIFGKPQTPFVYQSFSRNFCFAGCFDPTNFQVPPAN